MKSKKAAIEMSVGMVITIILGVTLLVGGIIFVQKVVIVATNAIDVVDNQVQSQLQKLFAGDDQIRVAFYPTSRDVSIKKGDTPRGFAFQIRNNDVNDATFSYTTTATGVSKCGSFSEQEANNMLLGGSGSIDIGRGDISTARLVKFVVPDTAPKCTMEYDLKITKGSNTYDDINFFLTIK
jgi:hypothetical protein